MNYLSFKQELSRYDKNIFSTKDAEKILNQTRRVVHTTLSRWTKKNLIHRVRQGWYSLTPIENKFRLQHTFPDTYISLRSAIERYGKTTQRYNTLDLITNKPKENTVIDNTHITFHTTTYFFGYEKYNIGSTEIFVATPEKTVIDLVHFTQNVALSNTTSFIQKIRDDIDKDLLISYLEKTGSAVLSKRVGYLLEQQGISLPITANGPYQPLDKTKPRNGTKISKWKLIDNVNKTRT